MRALLSLPFSALLLSSTLSAARYSEAAEDWFPYAVGSYWEYRGEMSDTDYQTGTSLNRFITWRAVTRDLLTAGDYRIALVEGLPHFSTWTDGGNQPALLAIVILTPEGEVYEAPHPNGELLLWHLRGEQAPAPPAVFLNEARYSLRRGMQVGEKFNPLDENPGRAPGDYNFGVEAIEEVSRELPPRIRAVARGRQYRLALRTNSGSQTKVFTPGVGYTEVEFRNQDGPAFGRLELVAMGTDPSGRIEAGVIDRGVPLDDQGNAIPTGDLIDDFLAASSSNERRSDFRRLFSEKARYFGRKCSVEEIISAEAEYHEKWPFRSLTRTGPLDILEQSRESVTFRYQFDYVLASLERAERKTGRHTMEMILVKTDPEDWKIASLTKVDEIDMTPRIIMGEKFGNLSRESTIDEITALAGPSHITTETYVDPEDGTEYATSLLFPDSPGEITVQWISGRPFQITITRPDSGFENPGGLRVGMTLAEAQNRNLGEIAIYGFDWDFGGALASWKGGRLAQKHAADHLFQATFAPSGPVPPAMQGPVLLSSRDPGLQALNPTIREITYYFADDPMHIGGLFLDLSSAGVTALLPESADVSSEELNAVDGTYRQTWAYSDRGVFLDMYATGPGGDKSIASVSVQAPCPLVTDRGIGIGDTFREVALAYADIYSDENAFQDDDTFVAGSIYGGTLFYFENGRVKEIFLGAAAE